MLHFACLGADRIVKGREVPMSKERDIQEVRIQDERRGKKPIDIEQKRRSLLLRKKFKEVLRSGSETQFEEFLVNDLGQLPGSREYKLSWQLWKSFHRHE